MSDAIDGYILTGGNSSRMGTPKGRLTLGGRSFVDRIAAALAERTHSVFTVGDSDLYPPLENITDTAASGEGRSSLAGLSSALRHARTEWIFVVACDLPFVTADLFAALADARSNEYGAVVPVDANGMAQPVCALYRSAACVGEFAGSIRRGDLSLRKLLPRVNAFLLQFETLSHLDRADHFFRNINTPEDLVEARRLAGFD